MQVGGKIAPCLNRMLENRKRAARHACLQKALHLQMQLSQKGGFFAILNLQKAQKALI